MNTNDIMGVSRTYEPLLDWISMTKPLKTNEVPAIARMLSPSGEWSPCYGRNGYKDGIEVGDMTILFSGNKNTVNVCLTGSGCRQLAESNDFVAEVDWINWFRERLAEGWIFKRTDWALDDHSGLLNMDVIEQKSARKHLTSAFHETRRDTRDGKDGKVKSRMIYAGSDKSDRFIRIYDKALKERVSGPWIRVEFECKGRYAQEMAVAFAQGGFPRIVGLISGCLSFREEVESDTNRSRWPISPWWTEFLGKSQRLKLAPKANDAPLKSERDAAYLMRISKLIARVVRVYGMEFLESVIQVGMERLDQTGTGRRKSAA